MMTSFSIPAFTRLFCLLGLMFAYPVALWAGEYAAGPTPNWVELSAIPPLNDAYAENSTDGIHSLLSESQFRVTGQMIEEHYRYVGMATDRSGLEALATIRREFDPSDQSLRLTRLVVIRDGKELDRTQEIDPQVLRREETLEDGIVTGLLTVSINVPDVRVGDVVDAAFLYSTTPILKNVPVGSSFYMDSFYPVSKVRLSVLWPHGKPIHFGPFAPGLTPEVVVDTPYDRYVWELTEQPPKEREEGTSDLLDGRRFVLFGSDDTWTSVVAALAPHYTGDYPLTPEWDVRVEEIRRLNPKPAEQAIAALRLVQDEIRYLSLSIGEGGYLARAPAVVIRSGFGDCKDKSLLLRTILARLSIPSDVALTDFEWGYQLPQMLPRLGLFDHMILRAKVGPETLWMDPTAQSQGGTAATAVTPDFGFALPITNSVPAGLASLPITDKDIWDVAVAETYRFSFLGLGLSVESTFKGRGANWRRAALASTTLSRMTRDFEEFYAASYPGIRSLRDVVVKDDPVSNVLSLREEYILPAVDLAQNGLKDNFMFEAEDFLEHLPKVQIGSRKTPLDMGKPALHSHEVRVLNAPINFAPPESVFLKNAGFDYRFIGAAPAPGEMVLRWNFRNSGHDIAADDVQAVLDDARRFRESISYTWSLKPVE